MKSITNIQLRAARQVLNLGVRDIATLLKISKASVSKAELGKTRDFFLKYSSSLLDFFEKNKIIFPSQYTVRFVHHHQPALLNDGTKSITRFQLKGARCLMNTSQQNLADTMKIGKKIISRAELLDNYKIITPVDPRVISILNSVFLEIGMEFPDPYSIYFKKYVDKNFNY